MLITRVNVIWLINWGSDGDVDNWVGGKGDKGGDGAGRVIDYAEGTVKMISVINDQLN